MKANKRCVDKNYKIRLLRIMAIYAIIMLIILIFSVTVFNPLEKSILYSHSEVTETLLEKEYVYVHADSSEIDVDTSVSAEAEVFTVKEYMGKIGVFSTDGVLIQVIEVYVKTLPEADKRLLGEGIEIIGKSALNSIIEDYSS